MDNNQLRRSKHDWVQRLEIHRDGVIDLIAVWGPLLAPMVPAGLTAAAIIVAFPDLLHIAAWAAWLIAAVTVASLEVLGIVSVETWLDMRRYNAENTDAEEQAPQGQALAVVVIYALVVISLVFVLKIWKEAALYSLIPLTMLGLITSWTIVLRKQHNQRVWSHEMQQSEQSEIDQLSTLVRERESRIEQLVSEHCTQIEQLSSVHQREFEQLNSEHSRQIKQLNARIEQLVEQLDDLKSVQAVQMPPTQIVQPSPTKVYKNGDIVHGLEHLELNDQIKAVAQRMEDSGQKVNKSRIAELLNCSRTTVTNTLTNGG